ncbi:Kanamycin B dioxygenase [Symbiodinium microadriaticum]|uniref:Kanamycin B dioxygenase n=1 Tax=Symbiodinium microadriaticum TaxID=2951 RepID=A0A1Q9C6K9_SYMMI|nr:Kanamycin B dioxygenase [Symbiodinium microadriaticum]
MEVAAPRPSPGLIWTASACRPAGRLFEARTADEAVCRVRRFGIAVLRAVLPVSLVSMWHAECLQVLRNLQGPPNRGKGIIGHPIVDASLAELLGADYAAYQLAVDVPYQGSEHQPLHSDVVRAVDAGLDVEPPSMISVNFPLVDIHEENGPLEILPGSQEVSLTAAPALLAKRHLRRVLLSRGDIVLRDLRTLHRGSPNRCSQPRPLAVWGFAKASAISGHLRGGRRTGTGGAFASRISIPEEVEAALEARKMQVAGLFMAAPHPAFDPFVKATAAKRSGWIS